MGGILSALGVVRLKNYLESVGRYAVIQIVLLAGMLLMIVMALGFGVTALTIWLTEQWGAPLAFAAVAAGFLLFAVVIQIIMTANKNARAKNEPTAKVSASAADVPPDQVAFGSVAAMAVIGYILGRQLLRR